MTNISEFNYPIILATNSQECKDKGLDGKNSEISIAILKEDFLKGEEKFYAYRWGMIYDSKNEFKPNIIGNQRIKGDMLESYYRMLPEARERLQILKNELNTVNVKNTPNYEEIAMLEKEIVDLRQVIDYRNEQIEGLEKRLQASTPPSSTSQIDEMEKLLKLQKEALEQARLLTPKKIKITINLEEREIDGEVVHANFEKVIKSVMKKIPVYLYGPAGTGKSELAGQIAQALNLKFYPASTITQEFKLSGYSDANGNYHETQFYLAFKNGGLFMLDEMDASAPETLVTINTAISQGYFDFENGRIDAHPDFRIIAGGNTIGNGADNIYNGRNKMDGSTTDRYFKVKIDYDIEIEKVITGNNLELISFARSLREAVKESEGIQLIVSYRSLSRITELESEFELEELLDMSLVAGIEKDDLKMLVRNMSINSDNKYYKALRKLTA